MAEIIQLAGENIQQDFGIRRGVDVAAFFFKQLFTQLMSIGQVAVMGKRDAVRGVNVKRLSLGGAGAASGWVTHMADTHVALKTLHMAGFENIVDQTICFAQTETIICIDRDDASGILTTVLKHR